MKRFLLDTGIASDFVNKRHGVFERACRDCQGERDWDRRTSPC
jgi:hypothetical protein